MHRYRLMLLVLSSVLIASGSLQAQLRRTSMRASDFQRAGLEVAWDSQVELDRQRSSAGGMQLQERQLIFSVVGLLLANCF